MCYIFEGEIGPSIYDIRDGGGTSLYCLLLGFMLSVLGYFLSANLELYMVEIWKRRQKLQNVKLLRTSHMNILNNYSSLAIRLRLTSKIKRYSK